MGLGGTAKKLQKVAGMAEDLYKKMNEVVAQLKDLQSDVEETTAQVDDLEREIAEQRAIVEALADSQGIDVDDVLADLDLDEGDDESSQDPEPPDDPEVTTGQQAE